MQAICDKAPTHKNVVSFPGAWLNISWEPKLEAVVKIVSHLPNRFLNNSENMYRST